MAALRIEELRIDSAVRGARTQGLWGPISLAVAAGECVCLSGPSGAGKTLLLRGIADLDPTKGAVYLGRRERGEFSAPQWRRQVAFLPAESAWWEECVGAHFPTRRVKYLEELGFDAAVLDRHVARLSTGERQRLALLRLLNASPRALLLDEPTASLDPANARRVEALIERYRKEHGVAVLWVSHDPKQIRRIADRHLRLVDGRLEPVPARRAARRTSRNKAGDVSR